MKKDNSTKEKHKVYQGNPLVEAIYQISLTAKKLMLCAIAQISPNDKDFKYYLIKISDFKYLAGIKGRTDYFKILIKAVRELRSADIDIYDRSKNIQLNIPFAVTAINDQENNAVGFSFPPELKPYLLQLKETGRFTRFELGNVMKMRSVYSIRLYELLKQYENTVTKERTFRLDELKAKLGVPEKKLKKYYNFKARVLEVAKKEVPEKTDIGFTYKPIKKGRAVHWIQFHIKSRKRAFVTNGNGNEIDVADLELPEIPPGILNLIPATYKTHHKLLNIIAEHIASKGEAYAFQNVAYVASKNPSKNYICYLKLSLKNNWGSDVNPFQRELFPKKKIILTLGQWFEFEGKKYEIIKNEKEEIGFYFDGFKGPVFMGISWVRGWIEEGKATLIEKKGGK
jgi:plasmid replication initiation protein